MVGGDLSQRFPDGASASYRCWPSYLTRKAGYNQGRWVKPMNPVRSHTTVRHRLISTFVVVVGALLSIASAFAEVSVRSEISPKAGSKDDLFLFTVTIEGARNAPPPTLTDDGDFDVSLLGPRTSISIVNGVMNSRISYVYHLAPRREGDLRTPKVSVDADGKTLSVTPIGVSVAPHHGSAGGQVKDSGDLLFLRQTASPTSVYEGQQVVHTLSVYTRVDLSDLNIEEPTNDGVWQETIADNQRSMRQVNNMEYTTVEALKALFPLRSGTITIPARKLKAKIPDERKKQAGGFDPFSDNFFQQFFEQVEFRPVTITSNDLTLQVKPLPAMTADEKKSAPPVAIVGPTSIRVDYPLEAINTGETKTVTVEVVSEGNLNTLKTIPLQVPSRFKVYEERPEVRTDRRSGKLLTHKIFKYSILALSPGLTRIPGAKLTFFDPEKGEYQVATTSDIAFPVRGQDLSAPESKGAPVGQSDTTAPSSSNTVPTMAPLPIAPPLEYEEPGVIERFSRYVSVQFALLLLAAVCGVGCIALIAAQRKPAQDKKDTSSASLNEVTTMKDLETFVRQIIATRLSRVSESSTMDELRSRVAAAMPDKNLALAISSLLDDIEVYNYGGATGERDREVQTLKERLGMILMQWRR